MLYSKKMLSILTIALLCVSIVMVIPVNAEVDVSVSTVGDVTVTVEIVDGNLHIFYNGIDILAQLSGLQNSMQSLSTQVGSLAAVSGENQQDIAEMNQTVNQLIGELDVIVNELYKNTAILARTIGLDLNSTVAENLKSGNYTVVSYFESMIATLDDVSSNIVALDNEVKNLANFTDTQLSTIYLQLAQETDTIKESVSTDVQTLGEMIQTETDRQTISEENYYALQQRLDEYIAKETKEGEDTRELVFISVVVAVGTITTMALVYTNKKKNNKPANPVQ